MSADPRVHGQGWARGQNIGRLQKEFSVFLICKQIMEMLDQTSVNVMTLSYESRDEGHYDFFHGPIILPYTLKTI